MKVLKSIVKVLDELERIFIIIAMIVMCILILINTTARSMGSVSQHFLWAEELARYTMIWMAFLAAAATFQIDGHYKMTAIVEALPPKAGNVLKIVSKVIAVVFMIILFRHGLNMCSGLLRMGQKTPTLKIPMYIPYASIPVSMALSFIQTILQTIINLVEKKNDIPAELVGEEAELS